jgi:hypothetical protein
MAHTFSQAVCREAGGIAEETTGVRMAKESTGVSRPDSHLSFRAPLLALLYRRVWATHMFFLAATAGLQHQRAKPKHLLQVDAGYTVLGSTRV